MMNHSEYLKQVTELAIQLGYNQSQVEMFKVDIMECWSDNLSPQECVDKVF